MGSDQQNAGEPKNDPNNYRGRNDQSIEQLDTLHVGFIDHTANEMRVVVRVVGFLLSVLLSSAKNLIFSTFLAVSYSHESKGCRLNLKIWLTLITTINDPNLINNDWSSLSMYQFQPTCILYYPFTIFFSTV